MLNSGSDNTKGAAENSSLGHSESLDNNQGLESAEKELPGNAHGTVHNNELT